MLYLLDVRVEYRGRKPIVAPLYATPKSRHLSFLITRGLSRLADFIADVRYRDRFIGWIQIGYIFKTMESWTFGGKFVLDRTLNLIFWFDITNPTSDPKVFSTSLIIDEKNIFGALFFHYCSLYWIRNNFLSPDFVEGLIFWQTVKCYLFYLKENSVQQILTNMIRANEGWRISMSRDHSGHESGWIWIFLGN